MTSKQCFMMFLAFTLVALFCATGVFAEDVSLSDFVTAGNASSTLVFMADSFTVGSSTSNQGFAQMSGSLVDFDCTFHISQQFLSGGYPAICKSSGSFVSGGFSNLVGCHVDGGKLFADSTDGSFTLTCDNGTGRYVQFFGWKNNLDYSSTFNFSRLSIDLQNVVVNSAPGSESMTIQPGYALRVYSASEMTIDKIVLSVPNSWNFPKDSLTSARYNGSRLGLYSDSTIIQGASADSGSFVPWVALNANLFGRASAYSYTWEPSDYSLLPSYSYVITNPFYAGEAVQNESGGFHQNTEMLVTVYYTASESVAFDLVPLRQSLSAQDGTFYYANAFDINAGVIHGTITPGDDEDPGTVDFGNPPIGGGNADQPPLSENTTIFGVLSTLTSTITDLFNRAGDAMRSLVQSSNSFFSAVIGFFGWLPPEWSAVLWSFFVILTVLGVVKLFL